MRKIIAVLSLAALLAFPLQLGAGAGAQEYVLDSEGSRVSIPQTHRIGGFYREFGEAGGRLSEPTDLFVGKDDCVYIADTGNNRIVKLNPDGSFAAAFDCGGTLASPGGVYVTANGDLYIADTANERIVHTDPAGEYIEEFVKPQTEMLSEDTTFQVSKIAVSEQGYIYTMKSQYLMMIDANNEFKGYIGDNKLGFSLKRLFIRTFASKEQQSKLIKDTAASYYSFDLGPDGMVYTTTGEEATSNQIQRINMVGDNVYVQQFFGAKYYNEEINRFVNPRFVDLCADADGLIYAIESYSGSIFVYDGDGNMLSVFGGHGSIKGMFNQPIAIDENSAGDLFVLDKSTGYVHRFQKTTFMRNVTAAIDHYAKGEYAASREAWGQVLELDANYPVANKGIGDCYYKEKNTAEAQRYYRLANNKGGYGKAFGDAQYTYFRDHFGLVVAAVAAAVVGALLLLRFLKRRSDRLLSDYYYGGGAR